MSEFSNQPGPYETPYLLGQSRRPASVTAAAVVGIICASISLLCNGANLLFSAAAQIRQGTDHGVAPRGVAIALFTDAVISLLFAITWLIISIGLLRLSAAARRVAQRLAVVQIVVLIAGLVISLTYLAPYLIPVLEQQVREQMQSNATSQPQLSDAEIGAATRSFLRVFHIAIFAFGLIVPLTMLICLNRSSAKAALADNV